MVIVKLQSPFSGAINAMELDMTPEAFEAAYTAWRNGELIQNAFSMLSREERKFIKTGITPEEWNKMFG